MSSTLLAQTDSAWQWIEETAFGKVIQTYLVEKGPSLLLSLIGAALILTIGLWGAKLAAGAICKILRRARIDETLAKFLSRLAQAVLAVIVVMAALERVGVNTTSFAAIIAAAGLAIGLALQGSLANFAAGMMIIVFRPFKVGDFVEAGGAKGIVEEIHIFHTLMRTPDNIVIVIPNSAITGGNIHNYSAKPTRRIDLVVGCGYDDDLKAVKRLLCELVAADDRILAEPVPVVAVSELGDSCVSFVVRPWVDTPNYWAVRWDLTEAIKNGFDERGFQIPFPQQDIHVHRVDRKALAGPSAHVRPGSPESEPRRIESRSSESSETALLQLAKLRRMT